MSSFFFSISDILDIVEHPIENITNNRCLALRISMYRYFQVYQLYLLA